MNAWLLKKLDKTFDSRIRLSIMTLLMVEEIIDYNAIKKSLNLTDGNLASHIKSLEKEEYIKVKKTFFGKKPNTSYSITKKGKLAFENHIKALENLIDQLPSTNKE